MGGGIRRTKNQFFILSILFILFITLGYAALNSVLQIKGYASVDENIGMIFSEVHIKDNINAQIERVPSIKAKTMITTKISFDAPGEMILEITGQNHGKYDVQLKQVPNIKEVNSCIQLSVLNHDVGEVVEHEQTKTFQLRVTSTCTSLTTRELDLFFKYEKLKVQNGEIPEEDMKALFVAQAKNVITTMEENYQLDTTLKEYYFPENSLGIETTEINGGYATIDGDGDSAIAVYDKKNRWCAVKNKIENEVRVIDNYLKCDKDIADNLIINGYGEYGDATNFTTARYNPEGYFTLTGKQWVNMTEQYVTVDPTKTYEEIITMRSNNTNAAYLVGFFAFDVDQQQIYSQQVMYVQNTLTTLKKDLKKGDTVVYLDNLSNWQTKAVSNYTDITKGFIFWNYQNSKGEIYPAETYSRRFWFPLFEFENINKSDNTITLNSPWNKETIPAGTKVSQSHDGASANYGIRHGSALTLSFETYKNTITGQAYGYGTKSFPYGTNSIKVFFSTDYTNLGGVVTDIQSMVFRKVTT